MSKINYLLDEHVEHGLRTELHQQIPDMIVWAVGDPSAPKLGTLDPEILLWCEANDFSLVTKNRRSMPTHLRDHLTMGRHVRGIFILNPKQTIGETVEELVIIWTASEAGEYLDQVVYLPVSG